MKSIIKSAKTVEEAIELGLKELGLKRQDVEYEIIEEGTKGLFGLFGGSDAIVKVKEKEKTRINLDDIFGDSGFSLSSEKKEVEPLEEDEFESDEDEEFEDYEDYEEFEDYDKFESDEDEESEEEQENQEETVKFEEENQNSVEDKEVEEIEDDFKENFEKIINSAELINNESKSVDSEDEDIITIAEKTKSNLEDLLEMMHIEAKVACSIEENIINYNLTNISENDTGIVIGSKGETLNALQYVLSLLTNRHTNNYYRVTLNVADYRNRRKKSIEANSKKLAYKVLKSKKAIALKPMNSYERRIVHSSLQSFKNIETISTGRFPNRKVVIKYKEQ